MVKKVNYSDNVDIKHLKVPNICFSLTDKYDKREGEYSKQRKINGFDDSETWSLTDTICNFILPRLKRFKEIGQAVPCDLSFDEWSDILSKIILSLELISRDKGSRIWSDDENKQVEEGLDLFREYFLTLSW